MQLEVIALVLLCLVCQTDAWGKYNVCVSKCVLCVCSVHVYTCVCVCVCVCVSCVTVCVCVCV